MSVSLVWPEGVILFIPNDLQIPRTTVELFVLKNNYKYNKRGKEKVRYKFVKQTNVLCPWQTPGLLVVSSTEAVPVEQFLKLSQEQHKIQHSGEYTNPKWFIPNTLKYYVLLHDMNEGDEQRYYLIRADTERVWYCDENAFM